MNKQELMAEMYRRVDDHQNDNTTTHDFIVRNVEARRKSLPVPSASPNTGGLIVALELIPMLLMANSHLNYAVGQETAEQLWNDLRRMAQKLEAKTKPNAHARKLWIGVWGGPGYA